MPLGYRGAVTFERARQPEQKQQRREAIIAAAIELFDEQGLHAVSLSAIGRKAGLSKANLYRYFECREAIYLEVFEQEFEGLAGSLEQALAPLAGTEDIDAVAELVGRHFARYPRLFRLFSMTGAVLEQSVSIEALRKFKIRMGVVMFRLVGALQRVLPALATEACQEAVRFIALYAGGVYHSAFPPEPVKKLQLEAAFAWTRVDFQQSIAMHTRAVLRGLRQGAAK